MTEGLRNKSSNTEEKINL